MKTKVKREQDRVLNKETGQYEWVWVERTRYIHEKKTGNWPWLIS